MYIHTAKIAGRILNSGTEGKNEDVLGEDQSVVRRGKETRDATGMLRISERTLDMDEKLCACFTDRQKASDRVNWTKSTHILRETDIDWRQRRLINKLNINQSVKVRLDPGETTSVKNGRRVDKEAVCHRYYSTCTMNTLLRVWRLQNRRTSNSHNEICR